MGQQHSLGKGRRVLEEGRDEGGAAESAGPSGADASSLLWLHHLYCGCMS